LNLRNHLASKHWRQYKPEIDMSTVEGRKKSTLVDFVRSAKCSDTHARCITDRVTQMLVTDLRPIQTVECDGFHSLIKYLELGYTLLSRKHFTANFTLEHATCKQCLKVRKLFSCQ